jgi:hypothetical protein
MIECLIGTIPLQRAGPWIWRWVGFEMLSFCEDNILYFYEVMIYSYVNELSLFLTFDPKRYLKGISKFLLLLTRLITVAGPDGEGIKDLYPGVIRYKSLTLSIRNQSKSETLSLRNSNLVAQ